MLLRRHCLVPQDVVELILERVPVEPLVRMKLVSKKWKSTIDSPSFQQRQLLHRKKSRDPDVIYVSLGKKKVDEIPPVIVLRSCLVCTVKFSLSHSEVCYGSCDGLICLYCVYTPSVVINPATRWHQEFPLSRVQKLIAERYNRDEYGFPCPDLGFGRDKIMGTFKPVWLYNSSDFGLDNVTTCEVLDFSTNAWRYILPSSPYRILKHQSPVYFQGSLYWFIDCEETKVLSLDLHTETFQIISKAPPFAHPARDKPQKVVMCTLDNRLCVSQLIWPTQVIWSLDSSRGWTNLCSIDLTNTLFSSNYTLMPIVVVDKTKILLHGFTYKQPVVIYDIIHKSFDFVLKPTTSGHCVYYYQSLLRV